MEIKIDEKFEIFPKPPIVEAVIEIRSNATSDFNEKSAKRLIEEKLEEYTYIDTIGEIQLSAGKTEPEINKIWEGVRFRSADKKYIVQFKKDGFVFSRLEPYNSWLDFSSEGLRIWKIFQGVTSLEHPVRLGLR